MKSLFAEKAKLSQIESPIIEQESELKKAQRRAYYSGWKALDTMDKAILEEGFTNEELAERKKALNSAQVKKLAFSWKADLQESSPEVFLADQIIRRLTFPETSIMIILRALMI